MIIVMKKRTFKPNAGTLWIDANGSVCLLHRIVPTEQDGYYACYQMTRLEDGKPRTVASSDKSGLTDGMTPCSCSVEIRNESTERSE